MEDSGKKTLSTMLVTYDEDEIKNRFKEKFGLQRFEEIGVSRVIKKMGYLWLGREPYGKMNYWIAVWPRERVGGFVLKHIVIRAHYATLVEIAKDVLDERLSKNDAKTWTVSDRDFDEKLLRCEEVVAKLAPQKE